MNLLSQDDHVLIGVDPSFSRTGLCVISKDGPRVMRLDHPPFNKSYLSLLNLSREIAIWVYSIVEENKPTHLIIEYPPPTMQFSAGMYMLSSAIFLACRKHQPYLSPPAIGRILFKQSPWKKSFAVSKVKEVYNPKPRICADEAEAFIMCIPFLSPEVQSRFGVLKSILYERYEI